jgi:hypothetical protein
MVMKKIIKIVRGQPTIGSANSLPLTTLEKGQIWKMGEMFLEITETGKRLVHYRLAKVLKQRGLRRHMASIVTVQAFLKTNQAELSAKSSFA